MFQIINKLINHTILKAVIVCFIVVMQLEAIAQDPQYAQYNTSPITVNPSYIGKDVVDWRTALNLRSNSVGAIDFGTFNTTSLSIEKNLFANLDKTSQLGIGVMMLNNGAGDEILKSNYFGLALSYNIQITDNSSIGLGLSAQHANRSIDLSAIRFETQFGSEGYQNSIPSGEYNFLPNTSYWSLNQGINYTYNQSNWGFLIGAAYFNSNKPMEGFFAQSKYPIKPKVTYQSRLWFNVGGRDADKSVHLTHLSMYQGLEKVDNLGLIYKHGMNTDLIQSLNIGYYHRFNQKSYPYIGIETKKWLAGFSYDIIKQNNAMMSTSKNIEFSFVMQLAGQKAKDRRYTIDNIIAF